LALSIEGYFAEASEGIEGHEMHEWNAEAELVRPQMNLADKQPRRLRIALVLLLIALAVVIVKDRAFWFGGDDLAASDAVIPESAPKATPAAAAKISQPVAAPIAAARKHLAAKTSTEPSIAEPTHQEAANSDSPVVAAKRTVLPPLDVEVVAGDTHRTIHPGSNVTKVEIPSGSNSVSAVSASMASLPTNAAERESLTSGMVPELRQTIDSNLPLLAEHMRVQGSVVLQAVVGADGIIEDLRVLSGPAVLSAAAQQAVRQWRFKPVLQNGQAVETKARITVNFSIRVSDSPAKTT
jgi:TonB family protein